MLPISVLFLTRVVKFWKKHPVSIWTIGLIPICILTKYIVTGVLYKIIMWKEKDNTLYRKFKFKDFSEAFAFMTRVALEAEKMDHHPKWTNTYNQLEIWLSTHDAGDIVTEKDRKLARKIDAIKD